MPDENTYQNSIPEENSIPPSPQESMADVPVSVVDSEPLNMPLEALESPNNTDIPVSLNNDNLQNEPISTPVPEEAKPEELPAEDGKIKEIPLTSSEPVQTSKTRTAQIPVNEPLASEPEIKTEPNIQEIKSKPASVSSSGGANEAKPESEKIISVPVIVSNKNKILELLMKAKNAIQLRKRGKLDKVMALFLKKSKITNDEVEKFLHVSDATATRYLSQLEKEGKIKQSGKTGKSVFYSKI